MKPNMETLELIRRFEGCRLEAYQDPVGIWTIGYGLTTGAIPGVTIARGMKISQRQADAYLDEALRLFGNRIIPLFHRKPTPNQFGAMLSLAYNIGPGAFAKSTCLKRFNAGDDAGAAEALTWFNKAGGKVLRGLVRRREAEHDLFLSSPAPEPSTERPDAEKTATGSTTLIAATGTALSGAGGAVTALASLDGTAQVVVIVLAFIGLAGTAWIMRERLRKLSQGI